MEKIKKGEVDELDNISNEEFMRRELEKIE